MRRTGRMASATNRDDRVSVADRIIGLPRAALKPKASPGAIAPGDQVRATTTAQGRLKSLFLLLFLVLRVLVLRAVFAVHRAILTDGDDERMAFGILGLHMVDGFAVLAGSLHDLGGARRFLGDGGLHRIG